MPAGIRKSSSRTNAGQGEELLAARAVGTGVAGAGESVGAMVAVGRLPGVASVTSPPPGSAGKMAAGLAPAPRSVAGGGVVSAQAASSNKTITQSVNLLRIGCGSGPCGKELGDPVDLAVLCDGYFLHGRKALAIDGRRQAIALATGVHLDHGHLVLAKGDVRQGDVELAVRLRHSDRSLPRG